MKLTPRNGIYQLSYRNAMGKRIRVSTGKRTIEEAEVRALEIISGRTSKSGDWTVANALDHALEHVWHSHKSFRSFMTIVKHLKADIGDHLIVDITYQLLTSWVRDKRRQDMAPATINRRLSALRRALREAVREGHLRAVPEMPMQVEDNRKFRWLSPAEESRLLEAVSMVLPGREAPLMHDVIGFLIDTGARLGEMLRLAPEHITDATVRFEGTKSRTGVYKARTVPLTRRARIAGRRIADRNVTGTMWTESQLVKRFDKAAEEAGMPEVNRHTLRHTCASRLVQRGADIYRVKDWMGHSNVTVTERYAHLADKDLVELADLLEGGEAVSTGNVRRIR